MSSPDLEFRTTFPEQIRSRWTKLFLFPLPRFRWCLSYGGHFWFCWCRVTLLFDGYGQDAISRMIRRASGPMRSCESCVSTRQGSSLLLIETSRTRRTPMGSGGRPHLNRFLCHPCNSCLRSRCRCFSQDFDNSIVECHLIMGPPAVVVLVGVQRAEELDEGVKVARLKTPVVSALSYADFSTRRHQVLDSTSPRHNDTSTGTRDGDPQEGNTMKNQSVVGGEVTNREICRSGS